MALEKKGRTFLEKSIILKGIVKTELINQTCNFLNPTFMFIYLFIFGETLGP
jgi:hypothetical protein